MTHFLALALACRTADRQPFEPSTHGDAGGDTCEERSLAPTDAFTDGSEIGDTLALLPAEGALVPTWFDGRETPVRVDVVPDLATLRQHGGCEIHVDTHVSLVADGGVIDLELDGPMALEPGRIDLRIRLADADWTSALDPSSVHVEPCTEAGAFELSGLFETGEHPGYLSHTCRAIAGGAPPVGTNDTGPTVSSEGADDVVRILSW